MASTGLGPIGDPLDQDIHSFAHDPVWSFVERIWGKTPRFVRLSEMMAFVRPLLNAPTITLPDAYAVLTAAATHSDTYVFRSTAIRKNQNEHEKFAYINEQINRSLSIFTLPHRLEHDEMKQPDTVSTVSHPAVISTHQIPIIFDRLAQRKYPGQDEALRWWIQEVNQIAVPLHEQYLFQYHIVRYQNWDTKLTQAKESAAQKRRQQEILDQEQKPQRNQSAFHMYGLSSTPSATRISHRRNSRRTSTLDSIQSYNEIDEEPEAIEATVYALDDGTQYVLDDGHVPADNRPEFLQRLSTRNRSGIEQTPQGEQVLPSPSQASISTTGDAEMPVASMPTSKQYGVDAFKESDTQSIHTEIPLDTWEIDYVSDNDVDTVQDDAFIGYTRRMCTCIVQATILDHHTQIQQMFDLHCSPKKRIHLGTINVLFTAAGIHGTTFSSEDIRELYWSILRPSYVSYMSVTEKRNALNIRKRIKRDRQHKQQLDTAAAHVGDGVALHRYSARRGKSIGDSASAASDSEEDLNDGTNTWTVQQRAERELLKRYKRNKHFLKTQSQWQETGEVSNIDDTKNMETSPQNNLYSSMTTDSLLDIDTGRITMMSSGISSRQLNGDRSIIQHRARRSNASIVDEISPRHTYRTSCIVNSDLEDEGLTLAQFVELFVRCADLAYEEDLSLVAKAKQERTVQAQLNGLHQVIEKAIGEKNSLTKNKAIQSHVTKMFAMLNNAIETMSQTQGISSPIKLGKSYSPSYDDGSNSFKGKRGVWLRSSRQKGTSPLPTRSPLHRKLVILFQLLGIGRHDKEIKPLYECALVAAAHAAVTEMYAVAEASEVAKTAILELRQARQEEEEAAKKKKKNSSSMGGARNAKQKTAQEEEDEKRQQEREEREVADQAQSKVPGLIRFGKSANILYPGWESKENMSNTSSLTQTNQQSTAKTQLSLNAVQATTGHDGTTPRVPITIREKLCDLETQLDTEDSSIQKSNSKTQSSAALPLFTSIGLGGEYPTLQQVIPQKKKRVGKKGARGGAGARRSTATGQEPELPPPYIWDDSEQARRAEYRLRMQQKSDTYENNVLEVAAKATIPKPKKTKKKKSSKDNTNQAGAKKKAKKTTKIPAFKATKGPLDDNHGVLKGRAPEELYHNTVSKVAATLSGHSTAPLSAIAGEVAAIEREKERKARRRIHMRAMAKYKKELKVVEAREAELAEERAILEKRFKNNPQLMPPLPSPPARPMMPERPKTPPRKEQEADDFFLPFGHEPEADIHRLLTSSQTKSSITKSGITNDTNGASTTNTMDSKMFRLRREGQTQGLSYINEIAMARRAAARAKQERLKAKQAAKLEKEQQPNNKPNAAKQTAGTKGNGDAQKDAKNEKPKPPTKPTVATPNLIPHPKHTSPNIFQRNWNRASGRSMESSSNNLDENVPIVQRPGLTSKSDLESKNNSIWTQIQTTDNSGQNVQPDTMAHRSSTDSSTRLTMNKSPIDDYDDTNFAKDITSTFLRRTQPLQTNIVQALHHDLRDFRKLLISTTNSADIPSSSSKQSENSIWTSSLQHVPPTSTVEYGEWTEKLVGEYIDTKPGRGGAKKKGKKKAPVRPASASLTDASILRSYELRRTSLRENDKRGISFEPIMAQTQMDAAAPRRSQAPVPLGILQGGATQAGYKSLVEQASRLRLYGYDSQSNRALQHEMMMRLRGASQVDPWTSAGIPAHARPCLIREDRFVELDTACEDMIPSDGTQDPNGIIRTPPDAALGHITAARLYHDTGRYSDALNSYESARQTWMYEAPDSYTLASQIHLLLCSATVCLSADMEQHAFQFALNCLDMLESLSSTHPCRCVALNVIGTVCYYQAQIKLAGRCFAHVLASRRRILDPKHPSTAVAAANLACCLLLAGRHAEGANVLKESRVILCEKLGQNHPRCITATQNVRLATTYFTGLLSQQMGGEEKRPLSVMYRPDLNRLRTDANYQLDYIPPLVDPFARGRAGKAKRRAKK